MYTSPAMYLAGHKPIILGLPAAAAVLVAGITAVFLNFDSDRQRQARGAAMVNTYL